jgi:hypothetical protein
LIRIHVNSSSSAAFSERMLLHRHSSSSKPFGPTPKRPPCTVPWSDTTLKP